MRKQPLVLAGLCVVVAVGISFVVRVPANRSGSAATSSINPFEAGQPLAAPAATEANKPQGAEQPSATPAARLPTTTGGTASSATLVVTPESAITQSPMQEPVVDDETVKALDQVQLMLRDYRTIAGDNPVGTNAEIMKSVMGGNLKQATLGPPEGQSLNADGELIDRWGTPYFFHQISGKEMKVRSAGPDRKMWTEDDIEQ